MESEADRYLDDKEIERRKKMGIMAFAFVCALIAIILLNIYIFKLI